MKIQITKDDLRRLYGFTLPELACRTFEEQTGKNLIDTCIDNFNRAINIKTFLTIIEE